MHKKQDALTRITGKIHWFVNEEYVGELSSGETFFWTTKSRAGSSFEPWTIIAEQQEGKW
jgi:membrane carboxypeptidase/penicillin-binding protein PbpC